MIKLSLIVDAVERISNFSNIFVNIKSGEIVEISEYDSSDEREEMYNEIDENIDDYIRMPSNYELDSYGRMEMFIDSLDNQEHQMKLYKAINGKGAFRRFKDTLIYLGIRESWFAYERKLNIKLAKSILEDYELEYINDLE